MNRRCILGLALFLLLPTATAAREDPASAFVERMLSGLGATPFECPEGAFEDVWVVTCARSDLKPRKLKAGWTRLARAEAETHSLRELGGWSARKSHHRRDYVYSGTPLIVLVEKKSSNLIIARLDVGKQCGDRTTVDGRPVYDALIDDDVSSPKRVKYVSPHMTRYSNAGWLVAGGLILRDGSVSELCVLWSSGFDREDHASVLESIAEWEYEPALKDGEPVDVSFTVTVEFSRR